MAYFSNINIFVNIRMIDALRKDSHNLRIYFLPVFLPLWTNFRSFAIKNEGEHYKQ